MKMAEWPSHGNDDRASLRRAIDVITAVFHLRKTIAPSRTPLLLRLITFFQNPSIVCHIMTAPAGVRVVPHAFCSFSEAVRGYACLSASFPIVRWYYYIQKVYTTWRPISVKHLDVLISVARHRRRQSVFCINSRNTKRPLFFCVLVAAKHF